MDDMTIFEAFELVVGVFPDEYHFLVYAGVIVSFLMFVQWIFGMISRLIFVLFDAGRSHVRY